MISLNETFLKSIKCYAYINSYIINICELKTPPSGYLRTVTRGLYNK